MKPVCLERWNPFPCPNHGKKIWQFPYPLKLWPSERYQTPARLCDTLFSTYLHHGCQTPFLSYPHSLSDSNQITTSSRISCCLAVRNCIFNHANYWLRSLQIAHIGYGPVFIIITLAQFRNKTQANRYPATQSLSNSAEKLPSFGIDYY